MNRAQRYAGPRKGPGLRSGLILLASAAAVALAAPGYDYAASHHIGAPALHVTCPAPDHLVTSWYKDGSPELAPEAPKGDPVASFPDEVHWLGWTELGGCGESVQARLGSAG
jgi:hypothetical protein